MTANDGDLRPMLDEATRAVRDAAEDIQTTTESIAGAIKDNRRGSGALDQLSRFVRTTPLRALALAFVAGLIVSRRW